MTAAARDHVPEGGTMNRTTAWAALVATLACTGSVQAHHSSSLFDLTTPLWVRGTVVRYQPINPHVVITLEGLQADGQRHQWIVEGPNLARLERMRLAANFLKVGDVIEVCGFPYRKEILAQHASAPDGAAVLPSFHGHVLALPDGRMQPWGPYGTLDLCIRPNDAPQTWIAFLDGDEMAREYWCRSLSSAKVPSQASPAFVGAVTAGMSRRCGT